MKLMNQLKAATAGLILGAASVAMGADLQDYARPGQLEPLREGEMSLYRTPWRSNVRTVSAYDAAQGVGVYWKHIPHTWTEEIQARVMQEMAKAGVTRARLAPHFTLYFNAEWTGPKPQEIEALRKELRACKAAGIRPCIVFVHIPPVGRPGTDDLQEWYTYMTNKDGQRVRRGWTTDLLPVGERGSKEYQAFVEKTMIGMRAIMDEARAAGFTEPNSYDLEMGQNLWWGAPAIPEPMPHTDLTALDPGGTIYEFDKLLMEIARKDGYQEPTFWWGQTHHIFEKQGEKNLPKDAAGYAVSIYSAYSGITDKSWINVDMYKGGPHDVWPPNREPMSFVDGNPPSLVLSRPESYMADFTRHDNLIELINRLDREVAITSLGAVPSDIPDVQSGGLSGWDIKSRAATRSLAFWLNQGARFVLLHSAFEGGQKDKGEMIHSLIPDTGNIESFTLDQSKPLQTIGLLTSVWKDAKKLDQVTPLNFRFALADDDVLIPRSEGSENELKASDAVTLLPFQIDEKRYAVAAYIMTPDISRVLPARSITLEIDRPIKGEVKTLVPHTQQRGEAKVDGQTITFDIRDDVTWVMIEVE
jgi:hypothetical protein